MPTTRLVFGLAIMTAGVLFTLDNLDVLEAEQILRFWPAALILVGLLKLAEGRGGSARLTALLWVAAGSGLLLTTLDVLELSDMIPLVLVLVGAKMVFENLSGRPERRSGGAEDSGAMINGFAMMAGVTRSSASQSFQGGDITAVMGGFELDLRKAAIAEDGEAVIDTFAFWGGIEIRVPEGWQVVSKGFALMGGFEDHSHSSKDATQRLTVKGLAFMGGVEIKN